jgi:hypothetical protein
MIRQQLLDGFEQLRPRQHIEHADGIGLGRCLTHAPLLPNGMGLARMHLGWLLGWLLWSRNLRPIIRGGQPSICA